ncbi:MAG: PDZ domain-containing protein [Verrucomicrobiales bacterium]|nr:PDZ domain-containing protein [Verrucomicrobiales bacterium]
MTIRTLIVLIWLTIPLSVGLSQPKLPRQGFFGAQFEPEEKSTSVGVKLIRILPDSSAKAAGFQVGDVIHSIDEIDVPDNAAFLRLLGEKCGGDEVKIGFLREGEKKAVQVVLKDRPKEKGDGYEVIYGSFKNGDFRQRTILTRPPGDGPFPAVLLLQGGQTCFPVDDPFGRPIGFVRIAQHFAKNGFVTMRVERPGCGDSEGGPLRLIDFDTELAGNIAALRKLKGLDFVDENRTGIYGLSMGGIMAPLVVAEESAAAIIVYGTTCINWVEGVVAQRRRLMELKGNTPAEINSELPSHIQFWTNLVIDKKSAREIAEAEKVPDSIVLDLWLDEHFSVAGRPSIFYQQIGARNLISAWKELGERPDCPRVFTIKGEFDWHVSVPVSTTWIVDAVNQGTPNRAESKIVPGLDHFSNRVESARESYQVLYGDRKGEGRFDPEILEIMQEWLAEALVEE